MPVLYFLANNGDIVVFKHADGKTLIKRISYINKHNDLEQISYQVLGDNRNGSIDSRTFGAIRHSQLEGKARLILFSINGHGIWQNERVLKDI